MEFRKIFCGFRRPHVKLSFLDPNVFAVFWRRVDLLVSVWREWPGAHFFSRISIFWVCPGSHLNHISWKKDKKSKKADILADFAWLIEVINSDDTLRSRAWRSEPRQGPGSRSDFIAFGIAEGEINSEFWKHEQTADRSRRIVKKRYNKSECFRS